MATSLKVKINFNSIIDGKTETSIYVHVNPKTHVEGLGLKATLVLDIDSFRGSSKVFRQAISKDLGSRTGELILDQLRAGLLSLADGEL